MRFTGLSGKKTVRALERAGFNRVSQRGSHIKLTKAGARRLIVIVPDHRELKPGVVDSILEMAELTPQEFKELLK